MKSVFSIFIGMLFFSSCKSEPKEWIRINQLGYRNGDIKVAVMLCKGKSDIKSFLIIDTKTGKEVMSVNAIPTDLLLVFSSVSKAKPAIIFS